MGENDRSAAERAREQQRDVERAREEMRRLEDADEADELDGDPTPDDPSGDRPRDAE